MHETVVVIGYVVCVNDGAAHPAELVSVLTLHVPQVDTNIKVPVRSLVLVNQTQHTPQHPCDVPFL